MLSGNCYCGDVAIQVDAEPVGGVICSCVTCQKVNSRETGFPTIADPVSVQLHSSHSYNIQSEISKLTVTKGTPKVYNDTKTDSGKGIARYMLRSSFPLISRSRS